jgi:hypothetical protein
MLAPISTIENFNRHLIMGRVEWQPKEIQSLGKGGGGQHVICFWKALQLIIKSPINNY